MDGNLRDAQAAMRARHAPKPSNPEPKPRNKPYGNRWSKLGVVNADCPSPTQGSIRNWGMKMKVRENLPS